MGYRSDVTLALTGDTLVAFRDKLASLPEKDRKEIEPLFTEYADKHLTDENAECWLWKDIKWYTDWPQYYPDIDFVDKFLNDANEDNYYFIRIGEEYDDNEIRGDWWDNPFGITFTREIVLDC